MRRRPRTETLAAAGIGIAAFLLYAVTAAPSLGFTDAGELAAVCTTLGVAHPTGYPLLTLLGHAWTALPLAARPIVELNLLAAAVAALSAAVYFALAKSLLARLSNANPTSALLPAGLAGATWATARTFWQQGVGFEVYALQLVVLAAAPAALLAGRFGLLGIVSGVGLANHATTVLLFPAMVLLLAMRARRGGGRDVLRGVARMLPGIVLGLSLYLYLPWRSAGWWPFDGPPVFDWGGTGRSFEAFLRHLRGGAFGPLLTLEDAAKRLGTLAALLPWQLGVAGILVGVLGARVAWRRDREVFWLLLTLLCTGATWVMVFGAPDVEVYCLTALVAAMGFFAAGLAGLRQLRWGRPLLVLALALPAVNLWVNTAACDRSNDHLVEDYTRNVVAPLESDTIVFSAEWDEWCSAFWYLQQVEGLRQDVVLVEAKLLLQSWYVDSLLRRHPEVTAPVERPLRALHARLLAFERGAGVPPASVRAAFVTACNALIDHWVARGRAVYVTADIVQEQPRIAASYVKAPRGLAFRLLRDRDPRPEPFVDFRLARLLASPIRPDDRLHARLCAKLAYMIDMSARYAAALGRPGRARALRALAARIPR